MLIAKKKKKEKNNNRSFEDWRNTFDRPLIVREEKRSRKSGGCGNQNDKSWKRQIADASVGAFMG